MQQPLHSLDNIKVVPIQAIKTYMERKSKVAALILNIGTRWRTVIKLTLRLPFSRKRTPMHTEQDAGLAPELVQTCLKKVVFRYQDSKVGPFSP